MARRAIALNTSSWLSHFILGKTLIECGDLEMALAELQQAVELSGGSSEALALRTFALAKKGMPRSGKGTVALLHHAAQTRHLPAYNLALAHAGLGDDEVAFNWLTRQPTRRMCA